MVAIPPAIILVEPQMGENIGAVARAMLNFGVTELRLVSPRDGWPNPKATEMAKHASSVIEGAQVFDSTEAAIADLHYVAASTARRRDMAKESILPREAATMLASLSEKSGILLGPERSGLANHDVVLADAIVTIPVDDQYPSINLAQAAGILCYEWYSQQASAPEKSEQMQASKDELLGFFEHLESSLDQASFFRTQEKREGMIHNIRNIFQRAKLSSQETSTLRGVVRSLVGE